MAQLNRVRIEAAHHTYHFERITASFLDAPTIADVVKAQELSDRPVDEYGEPQDVSFSTDDAAGLFMARWKCLRYPKETTE